MVEQDQETSANEFEIGVVSKITGISQHRLRIWERRYNVVHPRRNSSNRRYYSGTDVRKLLLIKSLLDAGNSVGSIASLSIEKLEEKIKNDPYLSDVTSRKRGEFEINAAVFGFDVVNKIERCTKKLKNLKISLVETDLEIFRKKLNGLQTDLLILEFETLESQNIQEIYNIIGVSGANHAIIIYWFSDTKLLESINKSLITTMRSPVEIDELVIISNNIYDLSADFKIDIQSDERIFKFPQLARIACSAPSIECECPHQLVTLIYSLTAFEKYSLECESKNLQDSKLHRFLHDTTCKARSLVEKALEKVVEIEGIKY